MDEVYSDDHLIVLHRGQIKANGRVPEILKLTESDTLAAAFGVLTQRKIG
jgi:ABC-2 type transport system ATP-binding protein